MKKLLFLILMALMITGCSLSKEEIGKTVTTSMQEKFDTDKTFKKYHLKVGNIQVFKETNTEYSGLVSLYLGQEKHQVYVNINVDGKNVMWRTENGAFLFLAQKEIDNLFN